MASRSFLLSALAALAATSPVRRNNDTLVDLGYVKYNGYENSTTSVISWTGIHYAASPEGSLRWQPPVDIEKKNNFTSGQIVDATTPGPICLQGYPAWDVTAHLPSTTEDCLVLNVRKPIKPVSDKLPVIINIHGGGYVQGSAQSLEYLTSVSNGSIMAVEIQYRLGGLGFLDGTEVRKCGTANAGLLDQRSAFHWVQRHIAAFGGDPSKVTIEGGSAGGGSVSAQLQLYGGGDLKPPFRAAMAEVPWWQNFHQDSILNQQYTDLLKATKCSDINCLRQLSFSKLAAGINQTYVIGYKDKVYGDGDFYYGPSVDGKVITELPSQAFSQGHFSKVPLWTDHDALEGLIFNNGSVNSLKELHSDLRQLWPTSNKSFIEELDKLYPTSDFNSSSYFSSPVIAATSPNTTLGKLLDEINPTIIGDFGANPYFYKIQQIFGDSFVSCGTRVLAQYFEKFDVPVWKTIWNTGLLVHGAIGYPFLFNVSQEGLYGSPQQQDILRDYVVAFVSGLDPNAALPKAAGSRPHWPQYGKDSTVLEFNFTTTGLNRDPDMSDRCEFFFNHPEVVRN